MGNGFEQQPPSSGPLGSLAASSGRSTTSVEAMPAAGVSSSSPASDSKEKCHQFGSLLIWPTRPTSESDAKIGPFAHYAFDHFPSHASKLKGVIRDNNYDVNSTITALGYKEASGDSKLSKATCTLNVLITGKGDTAYGSKVLNLAGEAETESTPDATLERDLKIEAIRGSVDEFAKQVPVKI